jgi:hypothetical protein
MLARDYNNKVSEVSEVSEVSKTIFGTFELSEFSRPGLKAFERLAVIGLTHLRHL